MMKSQPATLPAIRLAHAYSAACACNVCLARTLDDIDMDPDSAVYLETIIPDTDRRVRHDIAIADARIAMIQSESETFILVNIKLDGYALYSERVEPIAPSRPTLDQRLARNPIARALHSRCGMWNAE